jgi:hypothetical protein
MSGIEVVELTDGLEGTYEDFLSRLDHGLFYYSTAYRRFLVELLGCSASYRVAVRGGEVVGALPLMAVDGRYGTVWNSLPYFGSHGGVLALNGDAAAALYEAYAALLETSEVVAATVIGATSGLARRQTSDPFPSLRPTGFGRPSTVLRVAT